MPPHTQAAVTVSDGADSASRPVGQLVPAVSGDAPGGDFPVSVHGIFKQVAAAAREAPPTYGHMASISPHTEEFPGGIELASAVRHCVRSSIIGGDVLIPAGGLIIRGV
ncbi:hypothetical protein CYMTET_17043 [Cymbomonas tetramitiformis]|uniref:Uncharacterized protein n=1 Tax=Cymbomonas tetramitiformis TaxID=36881 RepID=A0AAE0GBE5_9CHLO|nr:hypothetical protein CYMTET_17043 [Cymbomonas tetramitiformis]